MEEVDLLPRLLFAQGQYVDVTFGTAGADTVVRHTLSTARPNDIRYLVVQQDAAGSVYRDLSPTRRAWGADYIILRSSASGLKTRLLLFTERI